MVLITGGTGFVGSHLIRLLLSKNYPVRAIYRSEVSKLLTAKENEIVERTLALVNQLKAENAIEYISFSYHILQHIHSKAPKAITQYLTGKKSVEELQKDKRMRYFENKRQKQEVFTKF